MSEGVTINARQAEAIRDLIASVGDDAIMRVENEYALGGSYLVKVSRPDPRDGGGTWVVDAEGGVIKL